MNLGIVLNRVSFEEKQIILACKDLGINVEQINNQRIFLELNSQKDLDVKSDLILQRSLSLVRALYSTSILETKGYKVVNDYQSTAICGDKLLTTLALVKHGVETPKTYVGFTPEACLENIEKKISYPLVTKPVIGSWGRMVTKIDNFNHLSSEIEAKEVMGNIFQKVHYFQEFIDSCAIKKDAPADIRVFYIGGECVAVMGRFRSGKDFRSNIALGGTAKKMDADSEMEKICKLAAKSVGGEILGIDLMITDKGYVCIEVNGTPGFEGLSQSTEVNIGKKIAEYLKDKYM
jgi:[lysine-biosynthesis-protein LysW]--L-2-aminoadipate ligase